MKKAQIMVFTFSAFVFLATGAFASQLNTDVEKFPGTNCPNFNNGSPFVQEILKSGKGLDKQTRTFNGEVWHIAIITSAEAGDALLMGDDLLPAFKMRITEKGGACLYSSVISGPATEGIKRLSFTLKTAEMHEKVEMDKARLAALEVDMKKELRALRVKYAELPIQSFANAIKRLK